MGASIFVVGPSGLNLAAGKAWGAGGSEDTSKNPARTDARGRFELPVGTATRIAVSYDGLDAWPVEIPETGPMTIKLPAPATMTIQYAIPGGDAEAEIGYQLLGYSMPGFKGVRSMHKHKVKNGATLNLTGMTPGKYQLWRNKLHRFDHSAVNSMMDRQFFEVAAGETKTIRFVRDKGATIKGEIRLPKDSKLTDFVLSVRSIEPIGENVGSKKYVVIYGAVLADDEGKFTMEMIPPGKYKLNLQGFAHTESQRRFSGLTGPAYVKDIEIEVPESGELIIPEIILELGPAKPGSVGENE